MTLPAVFPDWMPGWVQLVIAIVVILLGLAFLLMPFSVFGLKARLDAIELHLEEIQAELRALAMRLPERDSAALRSERDSAALRPERESAAQRPERDDIRRPVERDALSRAMDPDVPAIERLALREQMRRERPPAPPPTPERTEPTLRSNEPTLRSRRDEPRFR